MFFICAVLTCENICDLPPTHSFSLAVPSGACRSRSSSKSCMENNINNFNWMPHFALPFLNYYIGGISIERAMHFSMKDTALLSLTIVCKAYIQIP